MFLPEHGDPAAYAWKGCCLCLDSDALGKPYKTMWVTDLDYVKKERDKVLELLKKKALLRQKSLLGIEIDDCLEDVDPRPGGHRSPRPLDPFHPRSGEIPHGLVPSGLPCVWARGLILSSSRYLSN